MAEEIRYVGMLKGIDSRAKRFELTKGKAGWSQTEREHQKRSGGHPLQMGLVRERKGKKRY